MPEHPVPEPFDEDPVEHASDRQRGDRHDHGKHGGSVMSDPTLKERLGAEITDALRAGEKVRLSALRMLSAAITNREKELRHELSDDEVRDVAAKEVKKRAESIEAFEGAGRRELAERERAEREAIAVYAPEPLSEARARRVGGRGARGDRRHLGEGVRRRDGRPHGESQGTSRREGRAGEGPRPAQRAELAASAASAASVTTHPVPVPIPVPAVSSPTKIVTVLPWTTSDLAAWILGDHVPDLFGSPVAIRWITTTSPRDSRNAVAS